ncbi:hypothetical protein CRV01_08650 [Arcobacter sp. CECT 8983]|uniref:hypothetical protein n=1 Tax=Arcobacter sp. CECT 8983 TaxID=2044508 RepID=UPI00100B51DD|nr:hypothetical protein [Arcobacter sp. CECT 8983]RXJ89532.1 hypothetical protein CRV01_08650 [Arcobacter sp. CECT 8983]
MNFTESLTKHIDKLVGTLKSEEDLKEVLKRKLTKKELKVFIAIEEGKSIQETMELIKDDEERVNELYKVACKKVNQEKIKKELVDL